MIDGNTDISKIMGLIMENPEIIEKIKLMMKENSSDESHEQTRKSESTDNHEEPVMAEPERTDDTYKKQSAKKRRNELLCALKPYVSSERSRAIDTMLSVIEVIDIMKET